MPGLDDYIKKALEKGYSEEEVYDLFKSKGYTSKEIDISLKNINGEISQYKDYNKRYEEISMFKKIGILFSNPIGFFDKVRDKGIGKSLLLFLISSFIILGAGFLLQIFMASLTFSGASMSGVGSVMPLFGLGFILMGGIFVFILGIISTFVYSAISHGILKIMKGEGNYADTYNAYTYSTVPAILIWIVPLVGFLGFIYSIILMIFGFKNYHKVSTGKAVTAALVPLIAFILFISFLIFLFLMIIDPFPFF